ncbi:YmfQ family protein [Erwinia amylovora]|uniref:YmfQ family protein n=1 Tax=Erwinia amylovora TaxID=552 RepID=UPI001444298D|nr:YmfQ family protein [Erwinia amylovora]
MSHYSLDDYARALRQLLPPGRAWPRDTDSVHSRTLRALARSFQSTDSAAELLLTGSFPPTATTMLPEWESSLGLPDDCAISEIDSIAKRQAAVVSKLTSTGGLSPGYFVQMAAALGYTITITLFRPALCGLSVCGDALNGDEWPFVWRINAPRTTIKYAQAGISYCGDPLRSWGNKQLECQLNRLAPSHLILLFNYAG